MWVNCTGDIRCCSTFRTKLFDTQLACCHLSEDFPASQLWQAGQLLETTCSPGTPRNRRAPRLGLKVRHKPTCISSYLARSTAQTGTHACTPHDSLPIHLLQLMHLQLSHKSACHQDARLLSIPNHQFWSNRGHPYNGNLNSETPRDSKNTSSHCGDVSGQQDVPTKQL